MREAELAQRLGERARARRRAVGARRGEEARAGDRRERHADQQLRVVGDARALRGVGPAAVEDELALAVALHVERAGGHQAPALAHHAGARRPAGLARPTAPALLERGEPLPLEERRARPRRARSTRRGAARARPRAARSPPSPQRLAEGERALWNRSCGRGLPPPASDACELGGRCGGSRGLPARGDERRAGPSCRGSRSRASRSSSTAPRGRALSLRPMADPKEPRVPSRDRERQRRAGTQVASGRRRRRASRWCSTTTTTRRWSSW